MKTPSIRASEYGFKQKCLNKNLSSNAKVSFGAMALEAPSPKLDKVLQNKFTKKLFRVADMNPHVFNLVASAAVGLTIRPVSLLAVPGAQKENKEYVATKSVVGTVLTTASELALCIPLAKTIEKLGNEATKATSKANFPKINTPKFEAYNYFVGNGFALVLTLFSSMALAKIVPQIMNKILPEKKEDVKSSNFYNTSLSSFYERAKNKLHLDGGANV